MAPPSHPCRTARIAGPTPEGDNTTPQAQVTKLAAHDIRTWVNTHGPIYTGEHVDRAIGLLRQVPMGPAVPQPGQDALDIVVAAALAAA